MSLKHRILAGCAVLALGVTAAAGARAQQAATTPAAHLPRSARVNW